MLWSSSAYGEPRLRVSSLAKFGPIPTWGAYIFAPNFEWDAFLRRFLIPSPHQVTSRVEEKINNPRGCFGDEPSKNVKSFAFCFHCPIPPLRLGGDGRALVGALSPARAPNYRKKKSPILQRKFELAQSKRKLQIAKTPTMIPNNTMTPIIPIMLYRDAIRHSPSDALILLTRALGFAIRKACEVLSCSNAPGFPRGFHPLKFHIPHVVCRIQIRRDHYMLLSTASSI